MSKSSQGNKAMKEFLAEAQEFVESLSRNLIEIDKAVRTGEPDPDMVNEVFRGWHTLKGLSSTFGVEPLSLLAHDEESLLDDIRLGRKVFTPHILDSLFESIEEVTKILGIIAESGDIKATGYSDNRTKTTPGQSPDSGQTSGDGKEDDEPVIDPKNLIDAEVLEVLTEFEEHRLRINLQQGQAIYKMRIGFSLMSIDQELEDIKGRLRPIGEVITYLPSSESNDPDILDIDVLLALHQSWEDLEAALEGVGAGISTLVPGRGTPKAASDTIIPAPPTAEQPSDSSMTGIDSAVASEIESPVISERGLVKKQKEQPLSLRSVSQSVRVDIGKLDHLMNVVGELNIIRNTITKISDELRSVSEQRELAIELHRVSRGFDRRLAEMQEGILEVRMVPVSQMFDRLSRMTRKMSRNIGKEINLVISGTDTEVDKLIIEELSDPVMHIIRNAIDHGIEDAGERRAVGKPEFGTVALTAYQKGNHILIEVEDDGAGIDGEKILEVAVADGFLSKEAAASLSEREVLNLIFLPGVTTTAKANELSGRGVGMDVVKTNISALSGVVEVQSELGIGTKFTITMPVTLAIIPALLVSVEENTFAVPLNTVAEALTISGADVNKVMGLETFTLRGQTLPLCRMDGFFGRPRHGAIPKSSRLLVASLGQRRLGLVIDELLGQQDVVIKPLGHSLDETRFFAGATDLGDQKLSLVIDTAAVIEEFFASNEDFTQPAAQAE